jgi:hypothetical protein
MKALHRLILLTIGLNFFIVIGAGHGIGILGLVEIFGLTEMFDDDFKFSILGNYDNRLFTSAFISSVGQLILAISIFIKQLKLKFNLIYIGLIITLFAFFVLVNDLINSSTDKLSFWTGIPFLIIAFILLIVTTIMRKMNTK